MKIVRNHVRPDQRRRIGARAAALVGAAAVAFATLAGGAPASAAPSSDPCKFAVFIGVRGTGAQGGSGPTHGGRVWTSGGMGDQIAPLASKVSTEAYPTYFEALNYPATAPDYLQSVASGSTALINELNYLSTLCGGYGPAVIIAGHSQGANVISDALGNGQWPQGPTLTAQAQKMISAVVFYGDPQYWPTDAWNAPYSPGGYGALQRNTLVAADLGTYRVWGWTQGSTNPNPTWVPKIRSYCATGDFLCQNNPGDGNFAIHNSYGKTTTTIAANWIRYMISDFN